MFKRLRWLGNITLSLVVTLTFVSLWHGVWPGYYLNFYLEIVAIMAEKKVLSLIKALLITHVAMMFSVLLSSLLWLNMCWAAVCLT